MNREERIRHLALEITKVSKRKRGVKAKDFEKVDVCFRIVWVYKPYAERHKEELFNFLRHYRKEFFLSVNHTRFGRIIGIEDEEICFLLLGIGKALGFWSLINPSSDVTEKYLFLARSEI
jgi:hypothetical protein